MIKYMLMISGGLLIGLIYLIRTRKPMKEIVVYLVLSLFALVSWWDIFSGHLFNPNRWIGGIITWIGL
ncbi:hypothetical protein [Paenibacillus gorillae]|uniref:hypothetical protein n=1 Tax=Paenibacillus gorillae TaxID=1243662 RepID=UPI0004B6BABF|nr:hypothetical protein [Paenibacillus gorillae]